MRLRIVLSSDIADRAESLLFAGFENDCGGGDVLQCDAGGVENGDLRIARPSGLFAENDLAKLTGESGEDALFVRQLAFADGEALRRIVAVDGGAGEHRRFDLLLAGQVGADTAYMRTGLDLGAFHDRRLGAGGGENPMSLLRPRDAASPRR